MTSHTAWLHGLALVHASEGDTGPSAVQALVEAAGGSAVALLGALTWSHALQRHLPHDERARAGAELLERAVQAAAGTPAPSPTPTRLGLARPVDVDLTLYEDIDRLRATAPA